MTTIAVVHTGLVTVQPIKEQISEQIPEARVINIVDDSLLADVRAAGHLTPDVASRIHSYMANAQAMHVDIILNACSSVGEAVDSVRHFVTTPIVKIDEAMAEEASSVGHRIGVIATVSTTLEPTVRLVKKKADELGRTVEVTERIAEGAFEALVSGDGARHDDILKRTISTLAEQLGAIDLSTRDREASIHRRKLADLKRIRPFLDSLYRPRDANRIPADDVIVCRCEEVTAGEVRGFVSLGCLGPNQAKSFGRCGMGPCQGRMCGLTVTEIIAHARNVTPETVGYYRIRPPIKPVTLGELAGD
jgi:aspartate/glutamate racemase